MQSKSWHGEGDLKSLDPIPVDLLFQILLILPAKSVARFVGVSKLWATIIRSRDFRSYSFRSSPQKHPRFLLAINKQIEGNQEHWCFSPSQPGFVSRTEPDGYPKEESET
ncbi:unnamed protein product [Thlaspi arvense]|uniref:F-box domain-containing protein n=1 Tax=Thlaspi arvense TaxID=13288 RepID=A0AAU9RQ41_THLAR|nr:unnamed protein product [Thlaspi arvense]